MLGRFLVLVLAVGALSQQRQQRQQPFQQQRQQQQQQQPQQRQLYRQIPITSYINTKDDAGQYSLQHQDALGTVFTEQGILKPTRDGRDLVLVKTGSYSYISPEGVPVQISYEADEGGFRPTGDSIPVGSAPNQVQRH